LQEAAARLTIVSGKFLGGIISMWFHSSILNYFVAGAIIFGSAAYQAGNLIGAGIGLDLVFKTGTCYYFGSQPSIQEIVRTT